MSTTTFENHFFDPLQLIIDGHESMELKAGEEYESQAGSYLIKLNDLEIFSTNYGGVSALTIQLFKGQPRVRPKSWSQSKAIRSSSHALIPTLAAAPGGQKQKCHPTSSDVPGRKDCRDRGK